jgi:hypothetical protein
MDDEDAQVGSGPPSAHRDCHGFQSIARKQMFA